MDNLEYNRNEMKVLFEEIWLVSLWRTLKEFNNLENLRKLSKTLFYCKNRFRTSPGLVLIPDSKSVAVLILYADNNEKNLFPKNYFEDVQVGIRTAVEYIGLMDIHNFFGENQT